MAGIFGLHTRLTGVVCAVPTAECSDLWLQVAPGFALNLIHVAAMRNRDWLLT